MLRNALTQPSPNVIGIADADAESHREEKGKRKEEKGREREQRKGGTNDDASLENVCRSAFILSGSSFR
jgi:hypothetical protein